MPGTSAGHDAGKEGTRNPCPARASVRPMLISPLSRGAAHVICGVFLRHRAPLSVAGYGRAVSQLLTGTLIVVVPGGAPMRPECLACIEPGPQAPHPVPPSRTPHENTPQKDEVDGSLFGLRGVWIDSTPIRHGRACPGHPRLHLPRGNSWMPGTSAGHDGDNFGEYRILCVPGNALVSPRGNGVARWLST